ncbi:MAG: 1-acyl-sn-glycerol-3-phosphate acyltransferase [Clostridia bacterium]|nr:1-acyl-sn-glycerol-3-phosphate acyltransferase [Clostridia bacterium]
MADKFDYSKLKEGKTYDVLRPVGRLVTRCAWKVNYVGQENIPEEGGLILACNHLHAMDPLVVAMGMPHRQLHFMAKKELYDNWIINKLFTIVNAFPIVRGSGDKTAFNYAVRVVKEGYVLGIFPEGTRSKTGEPGTAKSGVALIAKEAQADILPVCVYSGDNLKKHTKYTVHFGKVIPYASLGLEGEVGKTEIKNAAQEIMAQIRALWEEGHCE